MAETKKAGKETPVIKDGVLEAKKFFEGNTHTYSAFGPFPEESKALQNKAGARRGLRRTMPTAAVTSDSPKTVQTQFLRSHKGLGGLTSSLQKPKPKAKPRVPNAGVFVQRDAKPTAFRKFYERGDLPVKIGHVFGVDNMNSVTWSVDIQKLDFHHYLPIFFDGIREQEEPFRTLSIKGTEDMIAEGGRANKVLAVVPQLIIPIKTALGTRDPSIICRTLKILQQLVTMGGDMIGEALVPYYRQLLPIMNIFYGLSPNMGDSIDYAQQKNKDVGEQIMNTLRVFELNGGEDAFINIKYMIPTYESCVLC